MTGPDRDTPATGGVVFDLDGTLVDSCEDITRAANHCLEAAGLAPRSRAEIQRFIGDGARLLLARAARLEPTEPRLDELLERFFVYYTEHATDHTRFVPGAQEVLAALSHLPLALCTNKPRVTTLALLEGLGIGDVFDAVVAAGDVPHHKPHPAPLERVGELLGVGCERLVLVGDGPQDVACARAAGARSIGISEAIIVPLELLRRAGPDAIVPLREVPALIARWHAGSRVSDRSEPRTRP
jgi:phosphoglycolate phosphatase